MGPHRACPTMAATRATAGAGAATPTCQDPPVGEFEHLLLLRRLLLPPASELDY
jgi:hypothetical protein